MGILDLPRDQFLGAISELNAQGVNTDDLVREYRRQNSPFAAAYDWADRAASNVADRGREAGFFGLLSKPEGTSGMEAIRNLRLEPKNFAAGLLGGVAQAVDAPSAAAMGLIPSQDMPMEALNTAGMAHLGAAAMPAPANALRMGAARGPNKADLDPLGYQKTKLNAPIAETEVDIRDLGVNLPRVARSWEDTLGRVILPFYGDRSSGGQSIGRINDMKFDTPVITEAGVDFMRGQAAQKDNAVWASNRGVATRLHNEAADAARNFEGRDILGVTGSMAPDANDFATFTGETVAEMMKSAPVTRQAAADFDAVMRTIDPEFVGVHSPLLRLWVSRAGPETRKSFIRLMDSSPMQKAGFPSPALARYGVTDVTQRALPAGMFGLGASVLDTSAPKLHNTPRGNEYAASVPHSTYDTQIQGNYFGSLPPVPQGLLFREIYDAMEGKTTRSGQPLNEAHKTHAIKTKVPAVLMDEQRLEGILSWLSSQGN